LFLIWDTAAREQTSLGPQLSSISAMWPCGTYLASSDRSNIWLFA